MECTSEDLKQRYIERLTEGRPLQAAAWVELWRLFVAHPWYQSQLESCARMVLQRRGLPVQQLEDLKHDAMLLLAKHLRRSTNLNIDLERAEEHFESWARTIIVRDCQQALRVSARFDTRSEATDDLGAIAGNCSDADIYVDFQTGLQQLDDRHRTVVALLAEGFTIKEIASQSGLTYRQARYALQQGVEQFRRLMAA